MKRIAFLGRGVHTIPSYRALLNQIAPEYKIVVYSEVSVEPHWMQLNHRYEFRSSNLMRMPRRMRELFFVIWLIKEHLLTPFDIVHAHSTFPTGFAAVILQKLFGVPAIISLDGGEGISFPDLKFGDGHYTRRTAINKWILDRAKVVTTLTFFQRGEVCKKLVINRDIKVLTRGVDVKTFSFPQNRKIGSPVRFLSVGYLSLIKDPETLIKTFFIIREQRDCQLVLIGKDYMNGLVHRMVKEMGISDSVRFLEHVDYTQLHEYYKKADVFLHTARYESQGMVIGEAMASGALVCGTHVGLMSDLSGECCITVPTQNPEALAAAVLDLLSSEEKMDRLRTNAFNWAKTNDLERSASDYRSMYSQLLNS